LAFELTALEGQLERTMLETFCAASNIKAFLQRPSCPKVLKTLTPLLTTCWGEDSRGTLMEDIRSLKLDDTGPVTTAREDIEWKKLKLLEDDVYHALASISRELHARITQWCTPRRVFPHIRHTVRGLKYAIAHASKRDSTIFIKNLQSNTLVPAVIREIFSVQCPVQQDQFTEYFFLVVHKFLPLESTLLDPFRTLPDFGASIWMAELEEQPTVIPDWHPLCHAIFRQWDKDTVVMKPLNRVSERIIIEDIGSS
jgi:hypothetical protein